VLTKKGEEKLSFVLPLTIFIISYLLAYFLGQKFRHLIPKGKESGVGSACVIGILIIFITKIFWFPSDKNSFYFAIGFGLASGVTSSITSYGQKIIKRRR
jgi:hypothetical protein